MKKRNQKKQQGSSQLIFVILFIAAIAIGIVLALNQGQTTSQSQPVQPVTISPAIENQKDLQNVLSELDNTSGDQQIDSGLTQLSTQGSGL